MHICIYRGVCMCVCAYTYVCMCVYIYIYIYIHITILLSFHLDGRRFLVRSATWRSLTRCTADFSWSSAF